MYEAFPLDWPLGFKRTHPLRRKESQFKQTPGAAQDFLHSEVRRIGGKKLIVSTNIPIRKDGFMYADYINKKQEDPGVAIYFEMDGEQVSMCCDQYLKVLENMYALGKSVEALRGIDRWGCSEFMKRAFTGFKALPESGTLTGTCWDILDMQQSRDEDLINQMYRAKAKVHHPDKGGDAEKFNSLTKAYEQALQYARQ